MGATFQPRLHERKCNRRAPVPVPAGGPTRRAHHRQLRSHEIARRISPCPSLPPLHSLPCWSGVPFLRYSCGTEEEARLFQRQNERSSPVSFSASSYSGSSPSV